jgi:chromate reductase
VELELWEGLKAVPPYDADETPPNRGPWVLRTWPAIREADAVLFATPEYNHSIPGAAQERAGLALPPARQTPLRNKPVAVVGASTGLFGAVWAQAELRKVLGAIGADVVDRELPVGLAADAFTEDGRLADDDIEPRPLRPARRAVGAGRDGSR